MEKMVSGTLIEKRFCSCLDMIAYGLLLRYGANSLCYFIPSSRKGLLSGSLISIILLSITSPCAHAHNKTPFDQFPSPLLEYNVDGYNIIVNVPFRNKISPVPNDKEGELLKQDSVSREGVKSDLDGSSLVLLGKHPLYEAIIASHDPKSTKRDINDDDVISEDGFEVFHSQDITIEVEKNVIIDAYRSSTVCVSHLETHWQRDAKSCFRFFVCSNNRVAAVMRCPKNFVWSNRVTNCVPVHSRWDDCTGQPGPERSHSTSAPREKISEEPVPTQDRLTSKTEVPFSRSSATQPFYRRTPHHRQQNQLRLPRKQPTIKRNRLGYRGSGHLFKRRRYNGRGYIIQFLDNTKRKRLRVKSTHQLNRRVITNASISDSVLKKRLQTRWTEKPFKHTMYHTSAGNATKTTEKRWYMGSKAPSVPTSSTTISKTTSSTTSTTSTTTTTTPATTTPNVSTTTTMKTRQRRKWRRRNFGHISHSYVRSKLKNPNTISKPHKALQYPPKLRMKKKRRNQHQMEKSSNKILSPGTDTVVTKWWKPSYATTTDSTEKTGKPPATDLREITPAPTTVSFNTTTHTSYTPPSTTYPSRMFIPECGISAAPMIVGGLPVQDDRWPWVVSLQLTWLKRHMCGATLVHPRWLVTAAHCMAEPDLSHAEDWRVIFENADSEAKVDFIMKHPSFVNGDNYPNDIALLRLKYPTDVTGFHVRHACLPSRKWNRSQWDKCWIMGWGEAKEGAVTELKELEVDIWKNTECSARWGWKRILNSHMCVGTGDSGACNGDSGGPLICRRNGYHFLAGVTSWGVYGCQTTGYPGVFVNVASYRQWIDDIIKTHSM